MRGRTVIQTLRNNRLLLVLCGVLDSIIAAIYLVNTHGPAIGTIAFVGKLALAAGVCTVAAGILRSASGKCWPLVLNGLALGLLGLIQYRFVRFPISLLTIALLVVIMAVSAAIVEMAVVGGRVFGLAAAASVGFALAFLAFGFRWIRIAPGSHTDLVWLGAFFGFTAVCMLGLAVRLGGNAAPRMAS